MRFFLKKKFKAHLNRNFGFYFPPNSKGLKRLLTSLNCRAGPWAIDQSHPYPIYMWLILKLFCHKFNFFFFNFIWTLIGDYERIKLWSFLVFKSVVKCQWVSLFFVIGWVFTFSFSSLVDILPYIGLYNNLMCICLYYICQWLRFFLLFWFKFISQTKLSACLKK